MTDDPATKTLPQDDDGTSLSPAGSKDPNLGRRIGRFHIKSVIASGGMGTVYLAMQDEPRRHVALKLMKHGIASRSALRRFKFEAQLLARLRHPGIAQIYESGTHDDGSGGVPYFAIEYIPGALPLTTYANFTSSCATGQENRRSRTESPASRVAPLEQLSRFNP